MRREIEHDLAASLTALLGYRQARWRAVILNGMAGIGKTTVARALADDDGVQKAFRDGVAWVDGSRDPEEEITRLCLALSLERTPGERWIECWRRWIGADERRLLLIIDDTNTAEGLPVLMAGLGPQVVALITTQQGAEVRAEVERWLPTDAIMEIGIDGLEPSEGQALVEAVLTRPLADPEWDMVREMGERVGWHPEALRLGAIEGREIGWQEMLAELRAGRMPWPTLHRRLLGQLAELEAEQSGWLTLLSGSNEPDPWYADTDVAQIWGVEAAVARRRLMLLKRQGLVHEEGDSPRWCTAPVIHLVTGRDVQR